MSIANRPIAAVLAVLATSGLSVLADLLFGLSAARPNAE
jgi:hypothetical protein